MRRAINTAIRVAADVFQPQGPIVELGAYYTPEFAALSNLRPYFAGREYIGCDIRMGPGVDRIEDAQALTFPSGTIGTMLMFEILEHLPRPHAAIAEANRVLHPDTGLIFVSVPFTYRLHGFPTDYWRFTASGVHELLAPFPDRVVFSLGPRLKPAFTFAVASTRPGAVSERRAMFEQRVRDAFAATRWRGVVSAFKERGKDFFGLLLGRADLRVAFFRSQRRRRLSIAPSEVTLSYTTLAIADSDRRE